MLYEVTIFVEKKYMRWQTLINNMQHTCNICPYQCQKIVQKNPSLQKQSEQSGREKKKKKNKNKNRWMINVCRYLTFSKIRSKEEHYARPKCLQEEKSISSTKAHFYCMQYMAIAIRLFNFLHPLLHVYFAFVNVFRLYQRWELKTTQQKCT